MSNESEVLQAEPATTRTDSGKTEVGSVFVSNYPPYSFWRSEYISDVIKTLNLPPVPDTSLGLYLHIPFCRKRCKFCYYRVYTDKNSNEIQAYLDALSKELELYSSLPAIKDRPLIFVYFGGGTPSYISAKHLKALVHKLKTIMPWNGAEEVTFECEPGTLTQRKLEAIREIGVTRLSLGVENFNDDILQENGRAHLSKEIFEIVPMIRALEFDQVNFDLIAGMVGESWENWRDSVQKTIDLNPDSVTLYQMELPFNTTFSKELTGESLNQGVADWDTKRAWHNYAIEELAAVGYQISSAYTMVKKSKPCKFVYRNAVWGGTDMIGAGVASFSHTNGIHFQNVATWDKYIGMLDANEFPLDRAFVTTKKERLTREMILQLKLGRVETEYFQKKFGISILDEFEQPYKKLRDEDMLNFSEDEVVLTRKGLLQADQLLPVFYDSKYRGTRYT